MRPSTFYQKLPKDISEDAAKIQAFLEEHPEASSIIMESYFARYWLEFQKFWSHERLNWVTFVLAPHNARWFIEWTFSTYPDFRTLIMTDMTSALEEA